MEAGAKILGKFRWRYGVGLRYSGIGQYCTGNEMSKGTLGSILFRLSAKLDHRPRGRALLQRSKTNYLLKATHTGHLQCRVWYVYDELLMQLQHLV